MELSKLTTHFFSIEDAMEYGVPAAVVLYNLRYLQAAKEHKGRETHEDKHWVNYSYEAMHKQLPYLSQEQIRRIMRKLLEAGAVIKDQMSSNPWDRTLYWHVTDMPICPSAFGEIDSSEPSKSTDLIHDNNITNNDHFDEFWTLYPRKIAKASAKKRWSSLSKKHRKLALTDLKTREWPENAQYIPHPATYINQRRWEDEAPSTGSQGVRYL